jgi:hypothetical protein
MVMSCETGPNSHPFWYACVLGVFHVHVLHTGPAAMNQSVQCIVFLWVHCYGTEPGYRYSFKVAWLPKIGFIDNMDDLAFSFKFLDPSLMLCGCHLIPAFINGRTMALLKKTRLCCLSTGRIRRLGCFLCQYISYCFYVGWDKSLTSMLASQIKTCLCAI